MADCSSCTAGQHLHDADARTGRDAGCPFIASPPGQLLRAGCTCRVNTGVRHVRSLDCEHCR